MPEILVFNQFVIYFMLSVLFMVSCLQEHFYLETQTTIAVPKGEDGEMELFVSTQNPTLTQVRIGIIGMIPFLSISSFIFVLLL